MSIANSGSVGRGKAASSYKTALCCPGTNCYKFSDSTEADPCWGVVGVTEEACFGQDDYGWVHACEGHKLVYGGEEYIPESGM